MNETMGMSYASLYYAEVSKNNELQKENKKLKELCDKYEEEHKTAFKLWKQEIEKIPTYEEKIELVDRINKATEYIKEKAIKNCWIDQYEANDLLNILKGSDKDDN